MMKTLLKATVLVGIATIVPSLLLAQWAPFPTKNVPKTATGEPNLTGPAPKTADGHPDFSGIWQNGGGGGGGGGNRGGGGNAGGGGGQRAGGGNAAGDAAAPRGGNAAAGAAAGAAPARGGNAAAPGGAPGGGGGNARGGGGGGGGRGNNNPNNLPPGVPATPGTIPNASFGNVGSGFPGGLPFTEWAAALQAKRGADNSKDNPDAHCLPMGFMQFHTHPQPRKIIQTPDAILIIYEANSGLRTVFMDGRSLPGPDAEPWWYGYSVGKWEGDTLVVETRGFRDEEWLDVRGSPLTNSGKVIEKFRRPNYGTLEMEITIEDPKAYTKPFTVKVTQRVMLNTELIEFICEDRDATHYVGAQ
jgi:hypothetical protein